MPSIRNGPPPLPEGGNGSPVWRFFQILSSTLTTLLILLVFLPGFIWFGCRIEPGPDQIAVLIRKTGENLLSGQIIALKPGQKGIQHDVLPEGRYFRNPFTWDWQIARVTDIPGGSLGVVTRLYGEDLPRGQIMAEEGTKGLLADVLRPGKYRLNPYAYMIQTHDAIAIRPGHVGVVCSLVGQDVLTGGVSTNKNANPFLVTDGMKGVIPAVLDPGTYYLNPYMVNVVEVNLQSQRFEMSGSDVISFLTEDGFTVTVEGTIEFAVKRDSAALLAHRIGDMDDILKKIVLPRARGFSRIHGSKHPAIDFIVGETRQKFQNDLDLHLREKCTDWGVDIKSVLIRKIVVPDQIASVIRDRQMAVQDARKYEQQIEQAKSQAELVKQEMLAQQNKEKVEADTVRIRAVINAKQEQAVQVVAAERELEVSRLRNEAAVFQAQATLSRAAGDRDSVASRNQAEAEVFASQIKAFGSGMDFARYTFYRKIGPRIGSVLSGDDPGGLGDVFTPYLPKGKEVKP